MFNVANKFMMSATISVVLIMTSTAAVSVEVDNEMKQTGVKKEAQSYSDISALEVARMKLKSAINNYKNGDLHATN